MTKRAFILAQVSTSSWPIVSLPGMMTTKTWPSPLTISIHAGARRTKARMIGVRIRARLHEPLFERRERCVSVTPVINKFAIKTCMSELRADSASLGYSFGGTYACYGRGWLAVVVSRVQSEAELLNTYCTPPIADGSSKKN